MSTQSSRHYETMSLKRLFRQIQRFKEILRIVLDLIFDVIISNLRKTDDSGRRNPFKLILASIISFLFRKKATDYPFPVKLRLTLEELGPTYIKFGQIMSLRKDFLPVEITEELSNLHNNVPPFPFYMVREILEYEYQKPLNQIFQSIEQQTFAAASLAQTHIAYLKNNAKVILKIQRPGIVEKINNDIRIMKFVANTMEKYIPFFRNYQPVKIVNEFSDYTLRELDFRNEAGHCDKFNNNFKNNPGIIFPKVYWDFTTERVLCMEFIEGCKANEVEVMKKWGLPMKQMVKRGVEAILQMLFIDGFFHGDPHPGNMLITKDGRIAFIDVGMIGRFSKEVRKSIFLYFYHMVLEDYETATKYLLSINTKRPGASEEKFRNQLAIELQNWKEMGITRYTLAQLIVQTMIIGANNGIMFSKDLVLMAKSLVTIEVVGEYWDPYIDLPMVSRPYLENIFMDFYSPKVILNSLINSIPDYIEFYHNLPQYTLSILKQWESGVDEIKIANTKQINSIIEKNNKERTIGLMAVVSILSGALMFFNDYLNNLPLYKTFGIIPLPSTIAFSLGIILFCFILFKKMEVTE